MKYAFTLILVTIFAALLSGAALADEATVTGNGYMRPGRSPIPDGACQQTNTSFRCSMIPNTHTWVLRFEDPVHKVYCLVALKLVNPGFGYNDRWDLWNVKWPRNLHDSFKLQDCSIRWISGNHAIVR